MVFNIDGIILALISLGLLAVVIIASAIFKKWLNNYFFWLLISILMLIYVIVMRFASGWEEYINAINSGKSFDDMDDIIISRAWLLDLCPFVAFALPVTLIIDPTRKIASYIAPWAILGAVMVLFMQVPFQDSNSSVNAVLNWEYIWSGIDPNPIYFSMHLLSFLMGALVMMNVPKYKSFDCLWVAFFIVIYFFYVSLVMAFTGCEWNVTGLSINDWMYGEYSMVDVILGLGYPGSMLVGYLAFILGIVIILIINNFVINKIPFCKYSNKMFAYKKWITSYGFIYDFSNTNFYGTVNKNGKK